VSAVGKSHEEYPFVSIGITCFDAEISIGRAIESALRQDWPNLEILIVDDASSDDSVSVVRKSAESDSRIRLLCHEANKGYAGALNTIFDAAQGEFVAIFDDDDVSRPDRISKQWRRITEYEKATGAEYVFCYSNRDVIKEMVGGIAGQVQAIGRSSPEPNGTAVADFLLWHFEDPAFTWGQLGSCTLFVRTRTILDFKRFDENFRRSAEWDLAIRAALEGAHFIAVDEALITQHITATQDKSGRLPLDYALRLREKHEPYLKYQGVYLASRAIARARYHYAKERRWSSRAQLALACILSPARVFPNELRKWRKRKAGAAIP
jgi:glycosyltransferase involved in cell wall biosynthesis